jgi:asparagine synthase (glutamine-hydrolysing)
METLGLAKGERRSFLDAISYLDMGYYLQDDLLVKGDRATIANSLEARVPFLDYRLVEYACSLPASYKIRGLTTKYVYKKMAEKIIPKELARRRKKGFGIPVARWISGELKGFTLDILSKERLARQGLFKYGYVACLLEEHFERRKDNRKLLWPLLMFQLWYERYAK